MPKIKAKDLIAPALDWAVQKIEFDRLRARGEPVKQWELDGMNQGNHLHSYSTDWAWGGEVVEREKITVLCAEGEYNFARAGTPDCYDTYWVAKRGQLCTVETYGPQGDDWGSCFRVEKGGVQGATPLIAAMRCYVASKLGDEVEVPVGLTSAA